MTFGFVIAGLQLPENGFAVPARFGTWVFEKTSWYDKVVPELVKGQGRMKRGWESLLSWRNGNMAFSNAVSCITFASAPES